MIASLKQRKEGVDKKEVGSRIREIRGERTQKDFAVVMDATQSYISDLERGKCLPSVSFLARLRADSGRSYCWILRGKEEPVLPPIPKEQEEIDYLHIQRLINLLEDAPPSEKPRFIKMLTSYLIDNL
jgi:transcriptional regulator with XRE-family HTH domain